MRSILTVALLAATSLAPAYAQTSGPYKVNESEVKPKYTDDAKARRVQGNVELDVVVKSDGTVGDVTVTKSLDPELDEQAVKATKQWRFRPGTKDSKPVDVMVQIELTFTLR